MKATNLKNAKNIKHTTHAQQKGFSLIELMVVIVIIGILGSVAVPTYKDYVVRAKVTEFFTLAQPVKLAVTEALMSGKTAATITAETLGLGEHQPTANVSNITVANAVITITGNTEALGLAAEQAFTIDLTPTTTPQGLIAWRCTTAAATQKYVPTNCRN